MKKCEGCGIEYIFDKEDENGIVYKCPKCGRIYEEKLSFDDIKNNYIQKRTKLENQINNLFITKKSKAEFEAEYNNCDYELQLLMHNYSSMANKDPIYKLIYIKLLSNNFRLITKKINSLKHEVSEKNILSSSDSIKYNQLNKSLDSLYKKKKNKKVFIGTTLSIFSLLIISFILIYIFCPNIVFGDSYYVISYDDIVIKKQVKYNDNYELEIPNKIGYKYLGVYDSEENLVIDENGKSLNKCKWFKDKQLFIKWKEKDYQYNIYDDSGNIIKTDAITYNNEFPNDLFKKYSDSENYYFYGWKISTHNSDSLILNSNIEYTRGNTFNLVNFGLEDTDSISFSPCFAAKERKLKFSIKYNSKFDSNQYSQYSEDVIKFSTANENRVSFFYETKDAFTSEWYFDSSYTKKIESDIDILLYNNKNLSEPLQIYPKVTLRDGSETNPYYIYTVEDFYYYFEKNTNNKYHFSLQNDLYFNPNSNTTATTNKSIKNFYGIFDGNGYSFNNICINCGYDEVFYQEINGDGKKDIIYKSGFIRNNYGKIKNLNINNMYARAYQEGYKDENNWLNIYFGFVGENCKDACIQYVSINKANISSEFKYYNDSKTDAKFAHAVGALCGVSRGTLNNISVENSNIHVNSDGMYNVCNDVESRVGCISGEIWADSNSIAENLLSKNNSINAYTHGGYCMKYDLFQPHRDYTDGKFISQLGGIAGASNSIYNRVISYNNSLTNNVYSDHNSCEKQIKYEGVLIGGYYRSGDYKSLLTNSYVYGVPCYIIGNNSSTNEFDNNPKHFSVSSFEILISKVKYWANWITTDNDISLYIPKNN